MFSYISNIILTALFIVNYQAEKPVSHTATEMAGYKFTVKIAGIINDTCYLGHYYGQHQYIDDTAMTNAKGEMVFTGKEALPGGIYFVVYPKKKYFEFIVNKEQTISLETDTVYPIKNMKIKGSEENQIFYKY